MNGEIMNHQDVREALVIACHRVGSQKKFAEQNNISETVLSDMINGRRDVSKRIAALVGFKRVVTFVKEEVISLNHRWCQCTTQVQMKFCRNKNECKPVPEIYGAKP